MSLAPAVKITSDPQVVPESNSKIGGKYQPFIRKEQNLNFNEYQEKANSTALYMENIQPIIDKLPTIADRERITQAVSMSYTGLGMGESGEAQGNIKKMIRDDGGLISEERRNKLIKEMGDQLWYIAEACKLIDVPMNEVAEQNIKKLFSRKERGKLTGDGDER